MKELEHKLGAVSLIYKDPKSERLGGTSFDGVFGWEKTNLVYDCNTKVVYYSDAKQKDELKETVNVMSPYISENGRYCRFIEGQIVEI
jgi:hypothetical protein